MFDFLGEFMEVLPCATFCERRGFEIKKIVEFANNKVRFSMWKPVGAIWLRKRGGNCECSTHQHESYQRDFRRLV